METRSTYRGRSRGFVLVTLAASAVVVLAVIGLAIDTGHLQLVKIRMQTAADAAALGAVQEFRFHGAGQVADAARVDSAVNGFTHGVNAVTVTVNKPPLSGYYLGDPTAVEVLVRQAVHTFFLSLIGFTTMDVSARAVARQGPGNGCVYILDPTASAALSASGGAVAQVNCGLMVNSTSGTAVSVSGGSSLTATSVNIVGNYSTSGGGTITPLPTIHVLPEPDPLAHVAAPAVGGCTQTNYKISGGKSDTLAEGVYCGGIALSGGATVDLGPGTYILKGGGLSVTGGSILRGTGVTFYNTAAAGYSYGNISLAGGTTIQLSAPVSGTLAGILFFQDRSLSGIADSSITGGASSTFDGALYFPTSNLSFTGGTGTEYTILVAKQVSFTGGSTLKNNYSSLSGGTPVRGNTALSE